jgi:histidinol phosphatase-like PHP family hydrolase
MERLFKEAAKVGIGIELNAHVFNFSAEDKNVALLPYQIAKEYGCKFYCGSDAHHPQDFDIAKPMLEKAIDLLELTEDDKFHIKR